MSFFSDAKRSKGDVYLEPWVEEAYYNIFGSEKKGAKINSQRMEGERWKNVPFHLYPLSFLLV